MARLQTIHVGDKLLQFSRQCVTCKGFGDPKKDFYNSRPTMQAARIRRECKLCCRRKARRRVG